MNVLSSGYPSIHATHIPQIMFLHFRFYVKYWMRSTYSSENHWFFGLPRTSLLSSFISKFSLTSLLLVKNTHMNAMIPGNRCRYSRHKENEKITRRCYEKTPRRKIQSYEYFISRKQNICIRHKIPIKNSNASYIFICEA